MLSVDKYNSCRGLANGYKPLLNHRDHRHDLDLGSMLTNGGFNNSPLFTDSCCYGNSIYDPIQSGVTSYMEIEADDVPGYPILMLHYGQVSTDIVLLRLTKIETEKVSKCKR